MSVVKNPCKVYIGNIPRDADEGQIQKMFAEIGKMLSLEFKGDFAFCEYGDGTTAEEAIRKFDGVRVRGRRLIVEPFRYRGGDPRYRRPPPKNVLRGEHRIIVTNLSSNTTAQDLRDWVEGEKLKSVTVTDVYNRHGLNEGVVEFRDKEDWDYAIRKLDQIKFDGQYVRVYDEREYNRRKLKMYDRPPPPRRGGHGGGGGRGGGFGARYSRQRKSRSHSPNYRRSNRSGNGNDNGGYNHNHKQNDDKHSHNDKDHHHSHRQRNDRERYRSNSNDRHRDRRERRDDRDDRTKNSGYNRSRSRSRSRNRNDRNDRYRDRNERYERNGQSSGGGGGGNDRGGGGYRDSRDRYDRR